MRDIFSKIKLKQIILASFMFPAAVSALPLYYDGLYMATDCTGTGASAICVAAGSNGVRPQLSVSADGGNTWAIKSIPGLPENAAINSVSCTGSGATAVCAGVGGANNPLLVVSKDGGNTWNIKTISKLPAAERLSAVSCTGNGTSAVCAAVGTDASYMPILAMSKDGGESWEVRDLPGAPENRAIDAIKCSSGNDVTPICVAGGVSINFSNFSTRPFLAVSTDGGESWLNKSNSNLPDNHGFYGVSCTGGGKTGTCIATANGDSSGDIGAAFLYVSKDSGNSWAIKKVSGLPHDSQLKTISCTGTGDTGVCTTAGNKYGAPAYIAVSTNGGIKWAAKLLPDVPENGVIESISCTGAGKTAICVAGGYVGGLASFLEVSTDGGNTWALKTVPGLPSAGRLWQVSCTGSGVNSVCAGVGEDTSDYQEYKPFKIVSVDGANNWLVKP